MPGNYSRYFVESPGNTILADHWNGELDIILANFTPSGVDDASANLSAFQATEDPGEVGTESFPTSLEGELRRIRKLLVEITGKTQWYETPVESLASLDSEKIDNAASSTDNALMRWDGVAGTVAQNSVVTVSDTGDMAGVAALSASGNISITGTGTHSVTSQFANEVGTEMTATGANEVWEQIERPVNSGGLRSFGSSDITTASYSVDSSVAGGSVSLQVTAGRPVFISIVSRDSTDTTTGISVSEATNGTQSGRINLKRDATTIQRAFFGSDAAAVALSALYLPAGSFSFIDIPPSSATVTYTLSVDNIDGTLTFQNVKLIAYTI